MCCYNNCDCLTVAASRAGLKEVAQRRLFGFRINCERDTRGITVFRRDYLFCRPCEHIAVPHVDGVVVYFARRSYFALQIRVLLHGVRKFLMRFEVGIIFDRNVNRPAYRFELARYLTARIVRLGSISAAVLRELGERGFVEIDCLIDQARAVLRI